MCICYRIDDGTSQNKWYWEDDNGDFNAMDDWLCNKLNNLAIGESFKQNIRNSTYEFKVTHIEKFIFYNTSNIVPSNIDKCP